MLIIPVSATPNQNLRVSLANQNCKISITQKTTGLYLDLAVSEKPIISGVLCLHAVKIVRDAYLGFIGELAWFDLQGTDDPVYTGLGTRWLLAYLPAAST